MQVNGIERRVLKYILDLTYTAENKREAIKEIRKWTRLLLQNTWDGEIHNEKKNTQT